MKTIYQYEEHSSIESPFLTCSAFWDCECDTNYIHRKTEKACPRCGVTKEEGPDARVNEILDLSYLRPDEAKEMTWVVNAFEKEVERRKRMLEKINLQGA